MLRSKHDFRVTLVVGKDVEVDNWFLERVLTLKKRRKDYDTLCIHPATKLYLLNCYKGYRTVLSNGDELIHLYFKKQSEEESAGLDSVLDDLSKQGIGWVVFE